MSKMTASSSCHVGFEVFHIPGIDLGGWHESLYAFVLYAQSAAHGCFYFNPNALLCIAFFLQIFPNGDLIGLYFRKKNGVAFSAYLGNQ